jgi:hypothetical protein
LSLATIMQDFYKRLTTGGSTPPWRATCWRLPGRSGVRARCPARPFRRRRRRAPPRFGASCNGSQIRGLPVQLKQEALNRLHLLLLEIRLAALAAYPGGNRL